MRLTSPAFERNADPIAEALIPYMADQPGTVLEIGSGPGQHVVFLAARFADAVWQPSDPEPDHLASIRTWAEDGPGNLRPPLHLDAGADWAPGLAAIDPPIRTVLAINVIHIAPWAVAKGIFLGAATVLPAGGRIILYGPMKIAGAHTGSGNQRFDTALRLRDPQSGIRDLDDLTALAASTGFSGPEVVAMPADNRLVIFTRA